MNYLFGVTLGYILHFRGGGKNEKNVRPKRDEGMSLFCVGEFSCEEKASHGRNGEVLP